MLLLPNRSAAEGFDTKGSMGQTQNKINDPICGADLAPIRREASGLPSKQLSLRS
jgi:hypothetical protein